jgi:hypothetical protein
VQIQEIKGKLEAMHQSPGKTFQTTYMDNHLREFKELLLENALLKVQNQPLLDKNLEWKEWWQIIQAN